MDIPELDVETFLSHHGVKGMHWHSRKGGSAQKASKPPKPTTQEIMTARMNHQARVNRFMQADHQVSIAKTAKQKATALKAVEKVAKEIASSKDTEIANRRTRGEKVATGLLMGAAGLGAIGVMAGRR